MVSQFSQLKIRVKSRIIIWASTQHALDFSFEGSHLQFFQSRKLARSKTTGCIASFISGQQVVEEILDAQRPGCPREFFNVPVKHDVTPHLDPETKPNFEMPFLRSRYDQRTGYSPNNPRQQVHCTLKHKQQKGGGGEVNC